MMTDEEIKNGVEKLTFGKLITFFSVIFVLSLITLILSPLVWIWWSFSLFLKVSATALTLMIFFSLLVKFFTKLMENLTKSVITMENSDLSKTKFQLRLEKLKEENKI